MSRCLTPLLVAACLLASRSASAERVKINYSNSRSAKVEAVETLVKANGHELVGSSKAKTPRTQTEVWYAAGKEPAAKALAALLEPSEGAIKLDAWQCGGDFDLLVVVARAVTDGMIRIPGDAGFAEYFIDKTEVTVAAYGQCVAAGACTEPERGKGLNWKRKGRDDHPVNGVNVAEAAAYCKWLGKALPTGRQWERAACGTDGRRYPWGNASSGCAHAVVHDDAKGMGDEGKGCGERSTWPVCSKPAGNSPYGLCDTIGNVTEWTDDILEHGKTYSGTKLSDTYDTRGGSYHQIVSVLDCKSDGGTSEKYRLDAIGFRCAYRAP